MRNLRLTLLHAMAMATVTCAPYLAAAQTTMKHPSPPAIPIRQLTPAVSTDSGVIVNTYVIRVLADGRVLHNDAERHRLLLFDTTLKHYTILADTAGQSSRTFGTGFGGLLPYAGDSTVWVDRGSQALVLIDAQGNFGRVMATPKVVDMAYYAGAANGAPGFDMTGRLFYRGVLPLRIPTLTNPDGPDSVATLPDSAPIIRVDFEARRLDTIAKERIPSRWVRLASNGGMSIIINPLLSNDEWAYLPDGTVAIVRAHDYHVDWFTPDGRRESTPKMPFDWRRVTDDEKRRMLDSAQHIADSAFALLTLRSDSINRARGAQGLPPLGPGRPQSVMKPSDLPDYYPAIRPNSQIRVDCDGNLWVMPGTSFAARGGTLFDVINRKGEIIERVQLPEGRNLQGFGPDGSIYMSVPSEYGWPRLERARIVR